MMDVKVDKNLGKLNKLLISRHIGRRCFKNKLFNPAHGIPRKKLISLLLLAYFKCSENAPQSIFFVIFVELKPRFLKICLYT